MSVIESASLIVTGIGEIFRNLTTKRVVFWTIYLITTAVIVGLLYDFFYSNIEYSKAERKIELLIKIKENSTNTELTNTADKLLVEIVKGLGEGRGGSKIVFENDVLLKLAASFFLPLFIVLASVKESSFSNILIGSIFIGAVTFVIAYLIPTLYVIWVNVALILVAQAIFLIWLAKKTGNL